jgi:hypothetical protein
MGAKTQHEFVLIGKDRASKAIGAATKATSGFLDVTFKMTNIVSSSINILGAASRAFQGLGRAMAVPISAAIEQERVERQLEAVLKSTGAAAGLNSEQLTDMAASMQRATTFGDEAIIGAQNLLLTFTNIGGAGGIFERTTGVVLDVASAMGMDLKSASVQVGKALNDPATGLSMLTRVGITFTDSQKDLIKSLQASGDVAGAQTVILQELERQFGGSAEAASETFGGSLTQLKNNFGDLMESVGDFMVQNEGVKALMKAVSEEITNVTDRVDELSSSQQGQVDIAETVRTVMVSILTASQAMTTAFGVMGNTMFEVITALAEMNGEMAPMTKAQRDAADEVYRVEQAANDLVGTYEVLNLMGASTTEEMEGIESQMERVNVQLVAAKSRYEDATDAGADFGAETRKINDNIQGVIKRLEDVDLANVIAEGSTDALAGSVRDLGVTADKSAESLVKLSEATKGVSPGLAYDDLRAANRELNKHLDALAPAAGLYDQWSRVVESTRLEMEFLPLSDQIAKTQQLGAAIQSVADGARLSRASLDTLAITGGVNDKGKETMDAIAPPGVGDRLGSEIARGAEAWQRSLESMAGASSRAFGQILDDWRAGEASLTEGWVAFNSTMKDSLSNALLEPIFGAQGPFQQLFEAALSPVFALGQAIADYIFTPMIEGILGYFGVKTAAESADAAVSVGIQTGAQATIVGTQIAAISAILPGLAAAASAALVATLGGAAAAASLLPGIMSAAAATGATMAVSPFAEGGFIEKPTVALMGEGSKAEVVIPLTKPDRARELLSEAAARFPGIFMGALSKESGGSGSLSGSARNYNFTINMNGQAGGTDQQAQAIVSQIDVLLGQRIRG